MASKTHALKQLGKLSQEFMKELRRGKLPELSVPKISQNDLEGVLDNFNDEEYEPDAVNKRSLLSTESSKAYAQLMAIAGLVAEHLYFDRTTSQRDVYYALKHLFKAQTECNKMILELGLLLRLKRYEMGIVPASKGWVAGQIRYKIIRDETDADDEYNGTRQVNSDWYDCLAATSDGGIAITGAWTGQNIQVEVKPGTLFILVIEKEGIYHRLCEEGFHMRVPCIMVTGCGFPDIATRALVSRVSDLHPELKLVGLCDHNPYGLALLLSYRFSSVATAFEGLGLQAHALRWLGLRYDHVKALLEDQDDPLDESSIQSLSLSDKRKIRAMLRTNTIQSMPEYVRELELMLSADRKCELEVLYSMGINFLGDFLERAMHSEDYI